MKVFPTLLSEPSKSQKLSPLKVCHLWYVAVETWVATIDSSDMYAQVWGSEGEFRQITSAHVTTVRQHFHSIYS